MSIETRIAENTASVLALAAVLERVANILESDAASGGAALGHVATALENATGGTQRHTLTGPALEAAHAMTQAHVAAAGANGADFSAVPAPVAAPAVPPPVAVAPAPAPTPVPPRGVTVAALDFNGLRVKMLGAVARAGKPSVTGVLARYGVDKISALPEDPAVYAKVAAEFDALPAAAA